MGNFDVGWWWWPIHVVGLPLLFSVVLLIFSKCLFLLKRAEKACYKTSD
jgi:hypothetical protein